MSYQLFVQTPEGTALPVPKPVELPAPRAFDRQITISGDLAALSWKVKQPNGAIAEFEKQIESLRREAVRFLHDYSHAMRKRQRALARSRRNIHHKRYKHGRTYRTR